MGIIDKEKDMMSVSGISQIIDNDNMVGLAIIYIDKHCFSSRRMIIMHASSLKK